MILDTLDNWQNYAWPNERFATAFSWLERMDPNIEDAKYAIDGNKERLDPVFRAEQFAEVSLFEFGGSGEHTLRRFATGLAVKLDTCDVGDHDALGASDLDDVGHASITFEIGTDKDVVDLALLRHE